MTIDRSHVPEPPEKKEKKVVNLKVYKNNLFKKAEQADRKFYKDCIKSLVEEKPLPSGWAFVAWDDDGYSVTYLVEDKKDLYAMPEMVKNILIKDIQETFF